MKYIFASDIHGSALYAEKIVEKFIKSGADKLVLLGDILYHGPRNDIPEGHNPKKLFAMLNEIKERIIAVRGNCDAEVDQMVLEFPIMADYGRFNLGGRDFFITHGHIYSPDNMPCISEDTAFVFGHIHIPVAEKKNGHIILNPGSASIPFNGNPHSYAESDGTYFKIMDFDGNTVKEIEL